ncbi:40875_t:CDS:1, partial [Gigaspora margarita]
GGNQIGGLNTAGEFRNACGIEISRIGAGVATSADIIPNGMWDEDWSIASGEPT